MKKFNSKLMKEQLTRDEMRSITGGSGSLTPGCPGYDSGKYSFSGGNGYSGCACVSADHAAHGSSLTGTDSYLDSRCN